MRIAMLLHKSVEHDSRVRREARALSDAGHEVTVLHLPRVRGELDGQLDGFTVRSVTPRAWVRRRVPFALYRVVFLAAFVTAVRRLHPDVVHAHDAAMLAPGYLGSRLARAKLVYDSHEYAAGVPYRERAWALFVTTLERALIRRCAAVITVSDGIAERLEDRHRLRARPIVVRNVPDPSAYDDSTGVPDLRVELGIGASVPLVLHLGSAAIDRGCEPLVRAMAVVEEAHLLFLGADDGSYVAGLRTVAAEAGVAERVHFLPSVPIARVLSYVRQASVGASLLEDTCENHRLALPNKVFEYLAAGIPAVVSDLPELRRLAGRTAACVTARSDDPSSIAQALSEALGSSAVAAASAHAEVSWTEEAERLTDSYRRIRHRALVLVRNPCTHDARILREAETLAHAGYETLVLGVVSEEVPRRSEEVAGVRVRRLVPAVPGGRLVRRLRARGAEQAVIGVPEPAPQGSQRQVGFARRLARLARTADYYRRGVGVAVRTRPDLVHCNDYNTGWIGVGAKALAGSRMVYDAHELWPDRNLRPEPRGWLLLGEALFVRVADRTITTSPGYATVMARRYRVPEPEVVRNVPAWESPNGRLGQGWQPDRTVVYFGAITRNRGLETAIGALEHSPELRMRFVGPDAWGYRETLARRARELGVQDRLELRGAVAPEDAPQALAGAAVGLALIEPACLSYRLTLPNKLFEYTLAGVPILASDVPVLAAFVREHSIGRVVDSRDPRQVAAALEEMLEEETQALLRAAVGRAREHLSWGAERERLMGIYRDAQSGWGGRRSALTKPPHAVRAVRCNG